MIEIHDPFADKVARKFFSSKRKSEYVGNLCGEYRNGNTTGKSYDDRIGNKFNDSTQFEYP
ncbi:hypothetical protein SDC9_83989 [bioreactor metagenome]|uniref:Uncharacterized protein n=1 Tax=bioreactor metagenome TaxID=1076179 RepID=A0A644ZAQ7_9ZZZZ